MAKKQLMTPEEYEEWFKEVDRVAMELWGIVPREPTPVSPEELEQVIAERRQQYKERAADYRTKHRETYNRYHKNYRETHREELNARKREKRALQKQKVESLTELSPMEA